MNLKTAAHYMYGKFPTTIQQECFPVGCVPPAPWPYSVVSNGEGVCPTPLDADPPLDADLLPREQNDTQV